MKKHTQFGIFLLGVLLVTHTTAGVGGQNHRGGPIAIQQQQEPGTDPSIAFGDSIWSFSYSKDPGLFGVEFDGEYFYVTGDNDGGDSNMIYVFDRNGSYVREFGQKTKNLGPSDWGWMGLAYRPDRDYFFGSEDSMISAFDRSGNVLYKFPGPFHHNPALAWDGEYLWVTLRHERIARVDTTGVVIASYPNPYWSNGLAWDDASEGNPWLWVSVLGDTKQPNVIYQFDPIKGEYTGVWFEGVRSVPGGLAFSCDWDTSRAILFELCQYYPDFVAAYDLGPITTTTPRGNKMDAVVQLEALRPTGDKKLDKRIDKIIRHIEKSLESKRWIDDTHLDPKHGKKVFYEEKKAVKYMKKLCKGDKCKGVTSLSLIYHGINEVLVEAISKKKTCFGPALVSLGDTFEIEAVDEKLGANTEIWVDDFLNQEIHTSCTRPLDEGMVFGDFEVEDVDKISYGGGAFPSGLCDRLVGMLVEADSILARVAVDDAIAASGKEKEIEKAEKEMAKAEKDKNRGKYDKAIDHYKKAWQQAQKATKKHEKLNQMMDETRSKSGTVLLQNRPNPVISSTQFEFVLEHAAEARLTVHDIAGRKVWEFAPSTLSTGVHSFEWDCLDRNGSRVPSGVYIYKLQTEGFSQTKKMVIIR